MDISVKFSWTNHSSHEEQCSWHTGFRQEACMKCLCGLCVCAVWGKHMWFCVQNSGYQYSSACLTGTEWLGYCSSLFWLWAVRGDEDAVGIFCILCALRKEHEGAKQLEGPVLTHCPFSPCKFWGEDGDKSSGTKDKLDPMGWWSRAKSIFTLQIYFIFTLLYFTLQIYFVHYEYSEGGRTSLQASFC